MSVMDTRYSGGMALDWRREWPRKDDQWSAVMLLDLR